MRLLLSLLPLFAVALCSRYRQTEIGREAVRLSQVHDLGLEAKDLHRLWENFKSNFGKTYELEEEIHRMKVYIENLVFIHHHNKQYDAGRRSHKVRVNEFSDMSHEEFVATMNGFKRSYGDSMAKGKGKVFLKPPHFHAPQKVDWRKKGYVTPVKNQGHCGSCWSFSSTGALEGQHFRKTGKLISLSEQNLVDCSTDYGNNGCEGGLMDQAFQYIHDNGGIDTERSYPYEAEDMTCRFNKTSVGASDKGFSDVPRGDVSALVDAIASVGPISVAIDASHRSFQFYSEGAYVEPECSPTQLDHGVLAVGYGTDQDGTDYWLIKNSWGKTWGEQGYIKMARKDNQCGVATQASYPLV